MPPTVLTGPYVPKIQKRKTIPLTKLIAAIGDSITLNWSLSLLPTEFYPHYLAELVNAEGGAVRARNLGISGNTTGQMVPRVAGLWQRKIPELVTIYGGINDTSGNTTVAAGSTSTSIVLTPIVGTVVSAKYGPGSWLTVNGTQCQVLSVDTDTETIELTEPLGFTAAEGQAVAIDTTANLVAMVTAVLAAGVERVFVLGAHYLNFSGAFAGTLDTTTVEGSFAPLRVKQLAAVATIAQPTKVKYVDLYAYLSTLIGTGEGQAPQGSATWYVEDGNIHPNPSLSAAIAAGLFAAIVSAGWLDALK